MLRRANGEGQAAFRRGANCRLLGEEGPLLTDANSQLVLVRSRDQGESWGKEPELIYANPFVGSQDPCLVRLSDGTLICTRHRGRGSIPASPGK